MAAVRANSWVLVLHHPWLGPQLGAAVEKCARSFTGFRDGAVVAEHGVQGVGDKSTCNVTQPLTLPKGTTTQALDLARSTAQNVSRGLRNYSWPK